MNDIDETTNDDSSVPEPTTDDLTVELVRDAIGVARGEISDEVFSKKYGDDTAEKPEASPEGSE